MRPSSSLEAKEQSGCFHQAISRRFRKTGPRSVIDGLGADVVTLALAYDIDAIAEKAKITPEELANPASQQQLPRTPRPLSFSSAKAIPRKSRIGMTSSNPTFRSSLPNPKTSGGARGIIWPLGDTS